MGLIIILALLIPLVAVVLDSQLGRALAARLERDGGSNQTLLRERVHLLESEVERLTVALQRLEEQSDFLHRLLEERPESRPTLGSGEPTD